MTYEEFLDFVKGYDEFNEYVNSLYELGMVTDDCPLWKCMVIMLRRFVRTSVPIMFGF